MCHTCSSMITPYKAKLGRYNYSNAVDTINYGSDKPKTFSSGLVNLRYSNMTDSEAQTACEAEYNSNPDAYNEKYGSDDSLCLREKKQQATGQQVMTTVSGIGNFFNQLGNALHVFTNPPAPPIGPTSPLPPPSSQKPLGAGAWIAIILSVLGIGTLVVIGIKRSNKSGGTK